MAPTFRKDDGFEDAVAQAQLATGPDVEIEVEIPEDEFLNSLDPMADIMADLDTGDLTALGDDEERALAELFDVPHDTNLAELLEESDLRKISTELMDRFKDDDQARQGWVDKYMKGIKLLGLEKEERSDPWDGACGVYHPVLTEAVVRYQAKAITAIFPALGPTKIKVMGAQTPERLARAKRVKTELNFQLTEKMREFRDETEAALMKTPIAGACFKKVYFCPLRKRAVSMMVPAEKLLLPAGATSVVGAERITHIQDMSKNHLKKLMLSGFYRDIDVGDPSANSDGLDEIGELEDDISGVEKVAHNPEDHIVLEIHCELDLDLPGGAPDGRPVPYVVSIEKESEKVLSIYRNWEDPGEKQIDPVTGLPVPHIDVDYTRVEYFVRYPYLPGNDSPYGMGLMHLIGGLTEGATGLLRMLLDAGVLANLSGGWKTKTLRWKNDDRPHRPGEWRDVEVTSGSLKDSLLPLPYKEPSQVLAGLLDKLVTEARNLASVPEFDAKAMSSEAPVGTIMAILEQNLQIQSGVHARLHAAVKDELRMIARIIAKYMPDAYDYEVEGGFSRREDFQKSLNDVFPQSDPNASTMGMRMIQHQAVTQLAQANPDLWNMEEVNKMGLDTIGVEGGERLLKSSNVDPADPVTENMNILTGKGAKVYEFQDHEAHIAVHMAFMQDPKIQQLVGQSPNAQSMMAAAQAHIAEHVAFAYRGLIEAELGTPLPPMGEVLPPEIETQLTQLTRQAADRVLGKNKQEEAAKQAEAAANDPVVQMQQRELAIEEQKVRQDYELKMARLKQEYELQMARIKSEEDKAELKAAATLHVEAAHLEQEDQVKAADLMLRVGEKVLGGING